MTRESLQDIIAAHPAGSEIDLGAGEYSDNPNPEAKQGIRVTKPLILRTSPGAKLITTASKLRNRPAVLMFAGAAGAQLLGPLEVIMPSGRKSDHYEAQHGIETRGTPSPTIEWAVREAQGNSYYFGRDPLTNTPTKDLILNAPHSVNPGRAHCGLQSVIGFHISHATWDNCGHGHSSVVCEPNGQHDWCQDGLIEYSTYLGNTGFCFSAGSNYPHLPNGQVGNVQLLHAKSASPFEIHLGPGPGQRFGPFVADDLDGTSVANHPTIRCSAVDGLSITGYRQRMTSTPWDVRDCTGPDGGPPVLLLAT